MQPSEIFINAVRNSKELPLEVRAHADQVDGIEEKYFDESYIDFLDEQIRLGARGLEWTEVLRRRREILLPFCNVLLLSGHIRNDRFFASIKVDAKTRMVVFWEKLGNDADI